MRCVLLLVLLPAIACGGDESSATGPITAHVTHYDYTFDLDTQAAHAKVELVADVAGDCVTLPFRAAGFANPMFDDAPALAAQADGASAQICGHGVDATKAFSIEADLSVETKTLSISQVGYSITQDGEGHAFRYLVSWVNGCDRFGPCDARPDQFATYTFHVHHSDPAMTVRCPGDITETSPTETECNFDHPGGPTYSTFGIAAYPAWTQTDKGSWGGVHVTVYDRASTGIAAAIDPAYHDGFLAWMQSQFGPYPFGTELRVLTAPTYWAGFEHPGNIVLDDGLAKQAGGYLHPVQHVLDHEMTHMWAGDQTTLASTYDFVWKESMAEYLSYVWEDMNDAATSHVTSGVWKTDSAPARYYPVPLDKPELFTYYGDVYGPGPMVLFRQLEVMTSRAQVLAAIKSVIGTPHALSVDDLVAALSRETGLDLTQYAQAWIKGSGAPSWPQLALTYTPGSLQIHQTNPSPTPQGCTFHVVLRGANPGETTSVAVDTFTNGVEQTVVVPALAYTVTALDLDPDHECLVFKASSTPRTAPPVQPWVSRRFADLTRRDP
jgi:aminopeptidase N